MNGYIIAENANNVFYAYYRCRFWRWDDTRSIWKESHLMAQKYERAKAALATLTPEDFLTNSAEFTQPDEYELDFTMLDALKDAKPCKAAPIEPVKEESPAKYCGYNESHQCENEAGIRHFINKRGEIQGCAGCCPGCLSKDTCEYACDYVKPTGKRPTPSAQYSDAATAAKNQTAAVPASASEQNAVLSATSGNSLNKPLATLPDNMRPKFDYTGLSQQTVADLHLAENEYMHGKKLAERGLVHMGDAIAIAHDALVAQCDKHNNQHSEDSFRAWCLSIGITKDTAYRLLQVSTLLDGSSPRQKEILEVLPPTLLYAVAKPSAPQELVEQVKNGEITTNKDYQALLKENQQLRTDRVNAMNQADREKARADRAVAEIGDKEKTIKSLLDRSEAADARADKAENNYKAALADVTGLQEQYSQMSQRANDAEEARIAARLQCQKAEIERDKAEARAKEAEAALKKQPITAVVDEEEVDRRANQMAHDIAADLAADMTANFQEEKEQDARNAYDSILRTGRSIDNIWQTVKPLFRKMPVEQREDAANQLIHTLATIQAEVAKCL